MPWYEGPTVAEALDQLQPPVTSPELPLRLPVQDVYKFDERRIIAGRIESGHLREGDALLFSPSNKTARIASIEAWNVPRQPVDGGARRAVDRRHARRADLRRARRDRQPRDQPADRDQRVPRPAVLARPASRWRRATATS